MCQPMMAIPGNTGESSCENNDKQNRRNSFFLPVALYVLTTPGCVLFMGISWFHLYFLCRFGMLYRNLNLPILFFCLLWWVGAIIYGIKLWRSYEQNRRILTMEELTIEDKQIRWFVGKKDAIQIFLRDKRVLLLSLNGLDDSTKAFLELKLSAVSFFGKRFWRVLACALLIAMTVQGAGGVLHSAIPFEGELGNYLYRWKDKKTAELVHNNVYVDGIEGIFTDIRTEIDLPDTLCLANSFNLHFAPDGTILTIYTMIYGFDTDGNFVDSYLITYDAQESSRLSVNLHGSRSALYREEKDLAPLIEGVSWIPLKQRVRQWEGEDCYGILYYGMREWYNNEGIRILKKDGTESLPPETDYYFYGYSISLFCPENEDITPLRYLYPDYSNRPITQREPYQADYYPQKGEDSAIESIGEVYERMIPEHSFDISLNDWGDVTFVSCRPMPDAEGYVNPMTDVSFYLLSEEQVVYRFPYVNVREHNIREWGIIDRSNEISFVMFTDTNGDGRKDVVIGILYITGAGPQGMIPRTEIRIYEDYGNEFVYNESLCEEIHSNILKDEIIAEDVRKYLRE